MHHFWNILIEPLLKSVSGGIVEIGADKGFNTINLVRHCKSYGKQLVVIDIEPSFDANKLMLKEDFQFRFVQEESLKALPNIKEMAAFIIDGDHNWYTVYNELKTIERNYPDPTKFPILIFHDTSWPYGRRDCYYEPSRIPKNNRNRNVKEGIKYGDKALREGYGFNQHLHNAITEGGEKNGVLTAIEDFMQESEMEFEWLNLPVYHGFGIMVSKKYLSLNEDLQKCLENFNSKEYVFELLNKLEQVRAMEYAELYHENTLLRDQLNSKKNQPKGLFNRLRNV